MIPANPINIRLIDHVVFRVRDLKAMVSFYTDVLGCRLERGPGEFGLAQLRAGQSLIDLVDVNGGAFAQQQIAMPGSGNRATCCKPDQGNRKGCRG